MYELGRTYVRHERFNEGANVLKRLVAGYPQSPYCVSALSELGLIYRNLGNDAEALRYYKQVVTQYPSSPRAKDAMLGIKNIYVDNNDVDSYFRFREAERRRNERDGASSATRCRSRLPTAFTRAGSMQGAP